MSFIDNFHSYLGIQDLFLMTLGILLYRQIRKTENKAIRLTGVILFILLFFYIFPDFAATFEAQRVLYFEKENNEMIEGFNLLYVWGRFPTYWLCGILIVVIDKLKKKKRATTTPKANAANTSSADTDTVDHGDLGSLRIYEKPH